MGMKHAVLAVPAVSDLRAKLLVNRTAHEFVTSDAPSVLHNMWCERFPAGSTGLASAGLQFLLPLSPEHVLVLFDPDVYVCGDPLLDVVDLHQEDDVESLNSLQVAASRDSVFYRSPSTQPQLDAMDLTRLRAARDRVQVRSHVQSPGRVFIQHTRGNHPARLRASWISVRPDVAGVPRKDRPSLKRREAVDALRADPVRRTSDR